LPTSATRGSHLDATISNYNNPRPGLRRHTGSLSDPVLYRLVESR
jgi:hypothetical protein